MLTWWAMPRGRTRPPRRAASLRRRFENTFSLTPVIWLEYKLAAEAFRDIFFLDGAEEKTKLEELTVSTLKRPFCGDGGSTVS